MALAESVFEIPRTARIVVTFHNREVPSIGDPLEPHAHVAAALELDEISLLKTVPPFAIDARERHLELNCLLGFKASFANGNTYCESQ